MDKRTFLKDVTLIGAGVGLGLKAFANQSKLLIAPFKPEPLSYEFSALEPSIDAKTMEIHYSKHYTGYVNNLNKAIEGTKYASMDLVSIVQNVSPSEKAIRNNAGGAYNHARFWKWLSPKTTQPSAKLTKAIEKSFGSLDNFKTEFGKAALGVFGSGWAWLIVSEDKSLKIITSPNQDSPLNSFADAKGTPILGLDVWEHAYYLKHQNLRADYIKDFWTVVNWEEVSNDFSKAV